MTIDDVKTRFLANRGIADPVARAADKEVLLEDIAAEWGRGQVELAILEAIDMIKRDNTF